MDAAFWEAIIAVTGVITAIGGAVVAVKKTTEKVRKAESNRILTAAKEEMNLIRIQLETRIETTENNLKNLESNVNKDLGFMKESYKNEIKMLGERIENLRDELRSQNANVVSLLSKLIDSK